jgi:hypothetical protein
VLYLGPDDRCSLLRFDILTVHFTSSRFDMGQTQIYLEPSNKIHIFGELQFHSQVHHTNMKNHNLLVGPTSDNSIATSYGLVFCIVGPTISSTALQNVRHHPVKFALNFQYRNIFISFHKERNKAKLKSLELINQTI